MPVSVSGPLVSIIVPVHNAAASLHRALRSVLSQTLTDYELILVDDCSADESIRMLKKYLLIHESPLTDALFLLVSKSDEVTTT